MLTEVQYHCSRCCRDFVVYHSDARRNEHCAWCGNVVRPTGRVRYKSSSGEMVTEYLPVVERRATYGCLWMALLSIVLAIVILVLGGVK